MIAEIIEAPINSTEHYEQVRQRAGVDDTHPPAGALLHIAGPAENGGWRIVTVWESREAAAQWGKTIRAARQDLGLQDPTANATYFDVHSLQHINSHS